MNDAFQERASKLKLADMPSRPSGGTGMAIVGGCEGWAELVALRDVVGAKVSSVNRAWGESIRLSA